MDSSGNRMTPASYALIAAVTLLSLAHHVDHVLRGVAGWPAAGGVTQFTVSLLVYPVIAVGLVLTRRGRAGAGFWTLLPAGGALFVLAIHLGPEASDSVGRIPDGYASSLAGAVALAALALFVAALVAATAYEGGLWRRGRAQR